LQIDQAINALQDIARALDKADQTNTNLVSVTLLLAISTIVFGCLSVWFTNRQVARSEQKQEKRFQEQLKKQDDEYFERTRPWIVISELTPTDVTYANGSNMSWEQYQKIPLSFPIVSVTLQLIYTNNGIRVANNIKKIHIGKNEIFTKEELQKETEKDHHLTLGPNHTQHGNFVMKWERWQQLDTNPFYIGYQISYDNGRGRSESGFIAKVGSFRAETLESWYT